MTYKNRAVQIGVASAGNGCGLAGNPGTYTKISSHRDWIKKHSGI